MARNGKRWNLFESMRNLSGGGKSKIQADDTVLDQFEGASLQAIVNFIKEVKNTSTKRKDLYADLEAMMKDSVVGSAVELIAEDATQLDFDKMHVCWAERAEGADEKEDEEEEITTQEVDDEEDEDDLIDVVNHFLYNILDIDERIWSLAYNIVGYGEVFLRTYHSEIEEEEKKSKSDQNAKLVNKKGKLFEIVQNPLKVQNIMEYGDTVGYLYTDKNDSQKLYPVKEFIHICNDRGVKREEVTLKITNGSGKPEEREFTVKYGTSFIESAREAFDTLQLIELILLVTRFNKSAFYRLFKIEVGGSTRVEINTILREFKKALSQAETIDLPGSKYNSKDNPVPYGGNVYIPVKNGKGDVSVDSVGGDMDIRSLLDVDYYRNKLFAGLKVPKAFLGEDESMSGGIGNQSLVRIDVRYARTVKRCIACLVRGIKEMCDYYLLTLGRVDEIDDYVICMPKLITAEETDRAESINIDLGMAQSVQQLLDPVEGIDKTALIKYLVCDVLGMESLWEAISKEEEEENPEDEDPYEEEPEDPYEEEPEDPYEEEPEEEE